MVIALIAAASYFGYETLVDADPERLPKPTQVVVPDPPDVNFDVPNPIR